MLDPRLSGVTASPSDAGVRKAEHGGRNTCQSRALTALTSEATCSDPADLGGVEKSSSPLFRRCPEHLSSANGSSSPSIALPSLRPLVPPSSPLLTSTRCSILFLTGLLLQLLLLLHLHPFHTLNALLASSAPQPFLYEIHYAIPACPLQHTLTLISRQPEPHLTL
ncbi:hypothetical protein CgunFtcFv8_018222 [Champsocephalus gunnari]|uniref:Uncharacterized protein n=1 Tax=Champsocephalus gunnari TaxID=52237 RepID=A0AAN8DMI3_CHAGU|nr:hypothetical protein CgunFtcFv8_018222 [Champsocephalus gunnari]